MTTDQTEFRMGELIDTLRESYSGNAADIVEGWLDQLKAQVEAGMAQARRDAIDELRKVLAEPGMDDRPTFLDYCLNGAIESGSAGDWMCALDYETSKHDSKHPEYLPESATILEVGDGHVTQEMIDKVEAEGSEDLYEVTHETIEKGLARIREAHPVPDEGPENWKRNLTSVAGLSQGLRNEIVKADIMNDASLLDVIGYLAILEVALFNEVRYA